MASLFPPFYTYSITSFSTTFLYNVTTAARRCKSSQSCKNHIFFLHYKTMSSEVSCFRREQWGRFGLQNIFTMILLSSFQSLFSLGINQLTSDWVSLNPRVHLLKRFVISGKSKEPKKLYLLPKNNPNPSSGFQSPFHFPFSCPLVQKHVISNSHSL